MTLQLPVNVSTDYRPYRFSQRDYVLLSKNGTFDGIARAELIEGMIVVVNAQYSRHVRVQTILLRSLADACDVLGGDIGAWIDGSISIDDGSMPQPDIFLSYGLPDEGPVSVDQLALVVEIADSTLEFDLSEKARMYAVAGIAEYWVVDVNGRKIHQMSKPAGKTYSGHRELPFGSLISAITVDQLIIETKNL